MNELKDITLTEVSLVDAGANPVADVVLFKRKNSKQEENITMTNTENITDVDKNLSAPDADKPVDVDKNLSTGDKPKPDAVTIDKDTMSKFESMVNSLTKNFNERLEKIEDVELTKTVDSYALLGADTKILFDLLKTAKKSNNGSYEHMIKILDDALATVKNSGTFDEIGKSGYNSLSNSVDAKKAKVEQIAKEIRKNKPQLTERQALDEAFQSHPELQF